MRTSTIHRSISCSSLLSAAGAGSRNIHAAVIDMKADAVSRHGSTISSADAYEALGQVIAFQDAAAEIRASAPCTVGVESSG